MSLCKRFVARLDIKGSRLIKGIRFEGLRVVGDPCSAAQRYASEGADELLYVDAVASLYGRNSLGDLLKETSKEVFIPITAGGGIRSVQDAGALLAYGADKIAINTEALKRPELITEIAERFGSQCVVVSIQARLTEQGDWEAMAEGGRERSGINVHEWVNRVQELGAGEVLLTSVDRDGTCSGPDHRLIDSVAKLTKIPLIVGGGFGCVSDVVDKLKNNSVSAISIGAALHFNKLSIDSLKVDAQLKDNEITIRNCTEEIIGGSFNPLNGLKVGIIDYGMGNQQSLLNALEFLGAFVTVSSVSAELQSCDILMLPGVGAFAEGIEQLKAANLFNFINKWVEDKKSLVGICLGMQMLFNESEEFGLTKGFGFVQGRVVSLQDICNSKKALVVPHVGWNRINSAAMESASQFEDAVQYFVHSYAATDVDPRDILYECEYGGSRFVAAIKKSHVVGFQFHPERSGANGLRLLASFCLDLVVK